MPSGNAFLSQNLIWFYFLVEVLMSEVRFVQTKVIKINHIIGFL